MIVSIFIYLLLCVIIVSGLVRAKAGVFNEGYLSADATRSAKGFAVLGVFLHHVSQIPALEKVTHELSAFHEIGYIFVGIFFFYSGYGLLKSLDSKPGYLGGFFKKRVLPVVVTAYLANVLYGIVYYGVYHGFNPSFFSMMEYEPQFVPLRFVLGILNVVLINDQAWFPIVIVIMYLAFMFAFKKFSNRNMAIGFVAAVALLQWAVFVAGGHFAWWLPVGWYKGLESFGMAEWWQQICALWFQGEWWVNSTMCFVFGLVWANGEKKFVPFFMKNYRVKFIVLLLSAIAFTCLSFFVYHNVSYWSEFWKPGIRHGDKALCLFCQNLGLFALLLFYVVARMKVFSTTRIMDFFSGISLEFYLVQRICLNSFLFLVMENGEPVVKKISVMGLSFNWNIALYFVCVFALDVLLAIWLKKSSKAITSRI